MAIDSILHRRNLRTSSTHLTGVPVVCCNFLQCKIQADPARTKSLNLGLKGYHYHPMERWSTGMMETRLLIISEKTTTIIPPIHYSKLLHHSEPACRTLSSPNTSEGWLRSGSTQAGIPVLPAILGLKRIKWPKLGPRPIYLLSAEVKGGSNYYGSSVYGAII